jgi:glycosyltransferase involved in cell wall biosynthesis
MISVVIPALNEEPAIARTIDDLRRALSGLASELIVVDDGSTDRTAAIAAEAGARVVSHPDNIGYGRSLKDGIAAAQYDIVGIIDADGTYLASDLPRLVSELDRGFDMVVGARSGEHYQESWVKAPLRRVLKSLVEFTVGRRVPDVNSGLRVFRKSTIVPYFPQLCNTFSFTTSVTLAYLLTGRFVQHVPVGYGARTGPTKVRLLKDSLRTLQYIVQGIVYYNPVKMFLLLAAGALAAGLLGALAVSPWSTPAAISVATLGALAAAVIFGMGLVADLLRQILIR